MKLSRSRTGTRPWTTQSQSIQWRSGMTWDSHDVSYGRCPHAQERQVTARRAAQTLEYIAYNTVHTDGPRARPGFGNPRCRVSSIEVGDGGHLSVP